MKFDVIYSLGRNCACAEYLKKHNLRLKAGPFDWIVSADSYAPFQCVLDEFNLFSDFSYLKVISQYDNTLKVEHSRTKYLFLHDFFPIVLFRHRLARYTINISAVLHDFCKI